MCPLRPQDTDNAFGVQIPAPSLARKSDPDMPVIVRFRADYKTEIERPGVPNAWDTHLFHEGETLQVPFWRAKAWIERVLSNLLGLDR
jgi:hypothetical protein